MKPSLFATYTGHIAAALDRLEAAGTLPAGLARGAITCEPPRDASHGDLSTNAAMVLAKPAATNPRALAQAIAGELRSAPGVVSADDSPGPASSTSGCPTMHGGGNWRRSSPRASATACRPSATMSG